MRVVSQLELPLLLQFSFPGWDVFTLPAGGSTAVSLETRVVTSGAANTSGTPPLQPVTVWRRWLKSFCLVLSLCQTRRCGSKEATRLTACHALWSWAPRTLQRFTVSKACGRWLPNKLTVCVCATVVMGFYIRPQWLNSSAVTFDEVRLAQWALLVVVG